MSPTPTSKRSSAAGRNRRTALICGVVFAAMTGAAFAAVPLYRAFCQSTGFAGTVSRAKAAPSRILAQRLSIGFDTNVRDLPWNFKAEQNRQSLRIGDTGLAFFTVTNTSDKPLTGRAVYNVSPNQAAEYFHKLQCFCFSDQTIAAHTTMRFPVVYFVDPAFAADPDTKGFSEVTLSYTFYPATEPTAKTAQPLGGTVKARL